MNKAQKSKILQPSHSPSNARKPLINITSMYTNSAEYPRPVLNKPNSTKNIKPRISIDQCNRPKIKQVHSRKNSRSGSLNSISSSNPKQSKQIKCKNHSNRTAMHKLEGVDNQYLCYECCLFFAKKGLKIKALHAPKINIQKNKDKFKEERQNQTKDYIKKSQATYSDLMNWRQNQTQAVKTIFQQFGKLIENQHIKMEEELQKVRQVYTRHMKMLQNKRQQKIAVFKKAESQVQLLVKELTQTKHDIQSNFDECVQEFSSKEWREIMDEYWKILQKAQFFVVSNSVMKLSKQEGIEMTMTVRSIENTKNKTDTEFTFSKQSRFETPPFQKSFKGIKQVDSYGNSGEGVSFSERESILDSGFHFKEVNPFNA